VFNATCLYQLKCDTAVGRIKKWV